MFLRLLSLGIVSVIATPTHADTGELLPLPRWEEPSLMAEGDQVNSLLPPIAFPYGPESSSPAPAVGDGLTSHDLALFLQGTAMPDEGAPARQPTPIMALREIPVHFLLQAQKADPSEYLIDPQGLIHEVLRDDLERLLAFHGTEARIPMYVLILDANQKLGDRASLDRIAGGRLAKGEACLAVYPLGEPWRSRLLVSKAVHQAMPSRHLAELSDLAEDCITDAQLAQESGQQLQRFLIKLSTRLFQLEKILPAPVPQRSAAPLHEVAAAQTTTDSVERNPSSFGRAWSALLLLGGAGAVYFGLWWRKRQQKDAQNWVWILPDPEVQPRLGGNFSGGTSAVIQYDTRVPRG